MSKNNSTPKSQGYYFPAEFHPHQATWLSWPHKEASWPGKIQSIYPSYVEFIKKLARFEVVNINVVDAAMENAARQRLADANVNSQNIFFHLHPTNDAWCRDHGPAFLLNRNDKTKKAVVDWNYNAWGNKYPPFDLDDIIPTLIGKKLGLPVFHPGIIMEGGSVDFNGAGTVITSKSCLLNPNRNPHLSQSEIEGIVGDDTDGHIDDTVRFINEDTVIAVVEENKQDDNYSILQDNLSQIKKMRLINGKQLNIIEMPMPDDVIWEEQRLPASYANFYIANKQVIVPTFNGPKDEKAIGILEESFSDREIVGIDSTDIIWGLGSFHCLSQQEPALPQ